MKGETAKLKVQKILEITFLRKLLKVSITILTCFLVLKILYTNSWAFTKLLNFKLEHLVLILAVFAVLLMVSFAPFFFIFKRLHKSPVSFWQLLPVLLIGRMANVLAPQSGTAFKAVAFKSDFNLSYTQFVNVFALFAWLTLLLNLFMTAFLILMVMPELKLFQFPVLYIITGLFTVILIGPVLTHRTLSIFRFTNPVATRIHEKLRGLFEAMTMHGKDKKLLVRVFFFSILSFALTVLLLKLIFSGMGVSIGYEHIALLSIVRKISNLFFITPGNIGVQELLYGAICESVGIGTAQGIMASIILRVAGYIVIFPIGIAFGGFRMFKRSRSIK